jgi:hypothetical protein
VQFSFAERKEEKKKEIRRTAVLDITVRRQFYRVNRACDGHNGVDVVRRTQGELSPPERGSQLLEDLIDACVSFQSHNFRVFKISYNTRMLESSAIMVGTATPHFRKCAFQW